MTPEKPPEKNYDPYKPITPEEAKEWQDGLDKSTKTASDRLEELNKKEVSTLSDQEREEKKFLQRVIDNNLDLRKEIDREKEGSKE